MSTPKRKPLNTAALAAASVEQPDAVHMATAAKRLTAKSAGGRGSRTDKVQIQGYFPEETRRRLKMLAVQRDRTLEDLLGEAIADLFTKHSA
jgi:hypothetical protein